MIHSCDNKKLLKIFSNTVHRKKKRGRNAVYKEENGEQDTVYDRNSSYSAI